MYRTSKKTGNLFEKSVVPEGSSVNSVFDWEEGTSFGPSYPEDWKIEG